MTESPTPYNAAPESFRIRVPRISGPIWLMAAGDSYLNSEGKPVRSLSLSNEEHKAGIWHSPMAKVLLAEVQEHWHEAELV